MHRGRPRKFRNILAQNPSNHVVRVVKVGRPRKDRQMTEQKKPLESQMQEVKAETFGPLFQEKMEKIEEYCRMNNLSPNDLKARERITFDAMRMNGKLQGGILKAKSTAYEAYKTWLAYMKILQRRGDFDLIQLHWARFPELEYVQSYLASLKAQNYDPSHFALTIDQVQFHPFAKTRLGLKRKILKLFEKIKSKIYFAWPGWH